jgi:RHS repeat-associated protein
LDEDIGLMDYNARFYSPLLNRFIQPDSIIPETYNPQTWNRYSYVNNRPINFNDPSGHCITDPFSGTACLTALGIGLFIVGATAVVWSIAYAVDPNVRESTDQIANDLIYQAKRWKDKGFKWENDIIKMEAEAIQTADNGKLPTDPNWCKKNKLDCTFLVTSVIITTASVILGSAICGSEAEDGCSFTPKLSERAYWPLSQNKDLNSPETKNNSLPNNVTIAGKKIPALKPIKNLEAY